MKKAPLRNKTTKFLPTGRASSSFRLIGLFFLLGLSSCGGGGKGYLTEGERLWLKENHHRLEVLFGYQSSPNAYYNEKGEYVGLFVDYLHELERLWGYEIPLRKFSTWQELMAYAREGRNFLILGITATEGRREYLRFSSPIVKIPAVIVSRKSRPVPSLDEESAYRTAVVQGYSIADYAARNYPGLALTGYKDEIAGLEAVLRGECDLLLLSQLSATQNIAARGFSDLIISGELPMTINISAAASAGDPALFRILDKTVDQFDPERRDRIYRTWAGFNSLRYSPEILRRGVTLAVLTAALLLASWLWLYLLKREVRRKAALIKEQERELLKVRRLEALGVVTGKIAHDFNNLLSGMQGCLDLARDAVDPESPAVPFLEASLDAMKRTAGLTSQLLSFSREKELQKEDLDLGTLAEEVTRFSLTGSKAEAEFRIDRDLLRVSADREQMERVIANLAINAAQAMPGGGRLLVSGANETGRRGSFVRLVFSDRGNGIPPDQLDHIFDPYYTTKEAGTGLGLASAYSIIKRHDGEILVASEPGEGSDFTLLLPALRKNRRD